MNTRALKPLHDHKITASANLLTLETLRAKGLTQSDYPYIEIENTLFDAQQKGFYAIAIGWPDGVYCFFTSSAPITLSMLFPVQLLTAYRNSFFDSQRNNWLG